MSNLLEQAIVDAAALREIAIKNAESALIEKYSKEFKQSVEKLLEQEDMSTAAMQTDPMMSPDASLSADVPQMTGADDNKEKAFEKVPASYLDGDDDQIITINFDQLKKQISSMMGVENPILGSPEEEPLEQSTEEEPSLETQPLAEGWNEEQELEEEELEERGEGPSDATHTDALDGGTINEEELEEAIKIHLGSHEGEMEEYEEELELELEDELQEQGEDPAVQVARKKALEADAIYHDLASKSARKNLSGGRMSATSMEEDIQITEEELAELAERLEVDLKPESQLRGYMGTTTIERKFAGDVEKAAARDAKAEEERAAQEAAMSDLKAKLEESKKENEELIEKMVEFEENFATLKENIEKLSISNAKLLYTNKVLGNASLNERQKEQIVENISKSTSVLEAKTIYNTLQSTVQGAFSTKKPKESLSEALNRGNSPFLNRKQQVADESFTERMKKLAGITNKT